MDVTYIYMYKIFPIHIISSGRTTEEVKKEVRQKQQEQLKTSHTTPETEIFHQGEKELYIERSLKITLIKEGQNKQLEASDVLRLLRQNPRNARIIVTGEAGSGKTTLLRNIANSWLQDEEVVPYDFVFFVPLGRSRSHGILDIICQDLDLLTVQCIDDLSKILDMSSKRILFLLDSYEELRHKTPELEKLIAGDLYSHSVVVVTARPSSDLTEITQRMPTRIETQLQDFSQKETASYIQLYISQNQQGKESEIVNRFFGKNFLQRPFNLALACYLYAVHNVEDGAATSMEQPATQTVLLSKIIQHLMRAYVRKKKGKDVAITTGSPLENNQFPGEAKAMLKEISRMCFHAFRRNQQWLNVKDSFLTMQDLLDFGLFTSSPEPNSVSVPHSLFLEYLAAVYLVAEEPAWEVLYGEIKEKSESTSPCPCLKDAVRPLENVIKFVVGLSPGTAKQLCKLFVIKQQEVRIEKDTEGDIQSDLSYEITLLNECNDDSIKSAIARALLFAPVVSGHRSSDYANNTGSDKLLQYFSEQESLNNFMKKAYGCRLMTNSRTVCWINPRDRYVWDDFPLNLVKKHNYLVVMQRLSIRKSTLTVGLLLHIMAKTNYLILEDCILCGPAAETLNGDERVQLNECAADGQADHQVLVMRGVEGLDCLNGVTVPGVGKLRMYQKEDMDLSLLSHSFTQLEQLHLKYTRKVWARTGIESRKWPNLKRLQVMNSDDVLLDALAGVCVQLDDLVIVDCKRVVLGTDGSTESWPSVSRLILRCLSVETTTEHLTESNAKQMLSKRCPSAEIYVYGYNEEVCYCDNVTVQRHNCIEYAVSHYNCRDLYLLIQRGGTDGHKAFCWH